MKAYLAPWSPQLLSILRIVTGFLFMAHGTQKWLGFPDSVPGPSISLSRSPASPACSSSSAAR